jgi:hypothetical protein
MNRVAGLVKKTRDETFVERLADGTLVNMTPAVFSLGGAALEIEFLPIAAIISSTNIAAASTDVIRSTHSPAQTTAVS